MLRSAIYVGKLINWRGLSLKNKSLSIIYKNKSINLKIKTNCYKNLNKIYKTKTKILSLEYNNYKIKLNFIQNNPHWKMENSIKCVKNTKDNSARKTLK